MATSRLISNVHRLSRATMAAMAAVGNDGQGELDEEEEEEDLGNDEETKGWADLAAATSRNWIGRQVRKVPREGILLFQPFTSFIDLRATLPKKFETE